MKIVSLCVFGQALQQRPLEGLVARLRDQKLQQQITDAVDQMPAQNHTNWVNDRMTSAVINSDAYRDHMEYEIVK